MKSLFFAAITAVILISSSCQKSEEQSVQVSKQTSKNTNNTKTFSGNGGGGTKTTQIYIPKDRDCIQVSSNCHETIIVKGNKIDELLNVCTGNPTDLANYFNGNSWQTEVFPDLLDAEYANFLSELQAGNYYLQSTFNQSSGNYYFLVMANTNAEEPYYVFEVTPEVVNAQ